jgi:hypothetical protein
MKFVFKSKSLELGDHAGGRLLLQQELMIYHVEEEEEDGAIFEIPRVRQTLAEQALSSTRNHLRSTSVDKLETRA